MGVMEASAVPQRAVPAGVSGIMSPRMLRVATDARLVALIREGRPGAFEALYDRHHRPILSFCKHMLGTLEEAEDAVQHTFLAAYNGLLTSDEPIHLRAWLFAIARNRCYSILRRRREQSFTGIAEPATEGLAAVVQRREDLRDLVVDMRRLPDDQRAALVLAELDSLSHEQIALVLGVPTRKVKALVFQARESLLASRSARDMDCSEIREQLINLRGGALRRTHLRRHLHDCAGCREFRRQADRQRRQLRVVLPVTAPVALKGALLSATVGSHALAGGKFTASGFSGGHGGHLFGAPSGVAAASGGVAGGGLLVSTTLKGAVVKTVLAAILATVSAAGTIVAVGGGIPHLLSGAPSLKAGAPGLAHVGSGGALASGLGDGRFATGSKSAALAGLLIHSNRFPALSRSSGSGISGHASSGAHGSWVRAGTTNGGSGSQVVSASSASKPTHTSGGYSSRASRSGTSTSVSSTSPSTPAPASHNSPVVASSPQPTYGSPAKPSFGTWSKGYDPWSSNPSRSYGSGSSPRSPELRTSNSSSSTSSSDSQGHGNGSWGGRHGYAGSGSQGWHGHIGSGSWGGQGSRRW